jgi:hypothetical protein
MGTNRPKAIGRYEFVEHLTGGPDGFFRARDPEGDRDVAVLLVPGELIGDATIHARVLHDAQTAAGLRHPHLAAILDVGEAAGGQLYVVTEPLRAAVSPPALWAAGFATALTTELGSGESPHPGAIRWAIGSQPNSTTAADVG